MLAKFKNLTKDWSLSPKNREKKYRKLNSLTMCKDCHTFYYKDAWHFERPSYLGDMDEADISVHFTKCSACLEQENAMYDAESYPNLAPS